MRTSFSHTVNPVDFNRATRELIIKKNREKAAAASPASTAASVDSPSPSPSSVVSANPSLHVQMESNQNSPETLEQTCNSVSSPNSVLSAQLSPASTLSSPNSVLSAEPSPGSIPADTSGSDSGIDSPTSSSSESNSSSNVLASGNDSPGVSESGNGSPGVLASGNEPSQPHDVYPSSSTSLLSSETMVESVAAAVVVKSEVPQAKEEDIQFSFLPPENGSYLPPLPPPSIQPLTSTHPPHPSLSTEIPSSFQFGVGTQQPQPMMSSFQAGETGLGGSGGGESLDSLLRDLGLPAPGQDHDWWSKNQELSQQIQQQQQLLQQLLFQQQQLHEQHPLQQQLPQQPLPQQMATYQQHQPVDVLTASQLNTRSISPSISPLPSAAPSPYYNTSISPLPSATPSPYYNTDSFQSPLPTHFDDNGYQNGPMHTTNTSLLPPQQTNGQMHTVLDTNASLLPPQQTNSCQNGQMHTTSTSLLPPQQTNGCQSGQMHTTVVNTNNTSHLPLDNYQNGLIHTNSDENISAHQSLSFVGSFSLMPHAGQQNSSADEIDLTQELLQHFQQ